MSITQLVRPSLDGLIQCIKPLGVLDSIASVLGWDEETWMPPNGIHRRSEQSAVLAQITHERWVSDEFRRVLSPHVDLNTGVVNPDYTPIESRLVAETYRQWRKKTAIPTAFAARWATLTSEAQHCWQTARNQNDYAQFAPHLDKIVTAVREKVQYLGYSDHPYDALLDCFEPGMTTQRLTTIFDPLKQGIRQKLAQCSGGNRPYISGVFDTNKQWDLGVMILKKMGFDFNRGRQDQSAHPFTTTFGLNDVRITTRFSDTDILEGLSSTIHEGGHALYEQGLDPQWADTPLGSACSLGIHESQSRLWEVMVGRHAAFWQGIHPHMQSLFPNNVGSRDHSTLYRYVNHVSPGPIRVSADEVSYNMHILIRFELEKQMVQGSIDAMALRDLWNEYYYNELGVRVCDDRTGILQDVHWSAGLIGYFPTYALGNLYSVMLFNAAKQAIPNLETKIMALDFLPLTRWLNQTIHGYGNVYASETLIQMATGESLSASPFLNYLSDKYPIIDSPG
ncbi:MAG: carboxypeptidase M32 [Candidatus Marinamargulisbacteria bacterium]|nr:carboxypeptidase M32 [Candidatus Marinamargulisbacteria bacterium]